MNGIKSVTGNSLPNDWRQAYPACGKSPPSPSSERVFSFLLMSDQSQSLPRVRVYTPDLKRPLALCCELAEDVWSGRELAWRLFLRDLSAQYRQTFFGYLWVFLPPLAASFAFIFLQKQGIVAIDTGGVPYPLFALAGTLLWQAFVDAVASPSATLNAAKPLLAKLNFPREAVLMAGLYMVGFNLLVRLVLLAGVLAWWRMPPAAGIWFLPVALLGLVAAGFAVGLLLCPLGGLYGDVTRAVPILTQFWMLLTPVVYPVESAGPLHAILVWNPATPLIVTAREALMGGGFTLLPAFWGVLAGSLLLVLAGLLSFRIALPHIIARTGS